MDSVLGEKNENNGHGMAIIMRVTLHDEDFDYDDDVVGK